VGQLDLLVLVEQWDFAGPLDRAVLRVLRDLVEHLVSAALLDLKVHVVLLASAVLLVFAVPRVQ